MYEDAQKNRDDLEKEIEPSIAKAETNIQDLTVKNKMLKEHLGKISRYERNTSLHFAAAKFNFIISLNFLASQVGSFQILSLILVQKCNDILRRTFCAFQVFSSSEFH